jgi:hypothetical protein
MSDRDAGCLVAALLGVTFAVASFIAWLAVAGGYVPAPRWFLFVVAAVLRLPILLALLVMFASSALIGLGLGLGVLEYFRTQPKRP